MAIDDGGSAYPGKVRVAFSTDPEQEFDYPEGLSKRDAFAMAALASGELFDARDLGPTAESPKFASEARRIAGVAYGIADAMLRARQEKG